MEGRNIPALITLIAGGAVLIACICFKFEPLSTLIVVLCTVVAFYILGLILRIIILKVKHDAEKSARILEKERIEAELHAAEQNESEGVQSADGEEKAETESDMQKSS